MQRVMTFAILLSIVASAGCLAEPPASSALVGQENADLWGVPDVHVEQAAPPPAERAAAPTGDVEDAMSPPPHQTSMTTNASNPAPLGEWIRGEHVDVRLVSVERFPLESNPDAVRANYTFEFEWHTQERIVVRGDYLGWNSAEVENPQPVWSTTQHARDAALLLDIYTVFGDYPDTVGSGLHRVPDWDRYWFAVQ